MSLSITHRTADLQILTPPPAPQPPVIQLNTDPSLLVQLATAYRDWLPQPPPDPAPILAPLFREGPFDAASCPKTTTRHPLIGTQQDGCPYRFTSYRNYEHFHVVARLAYNFTPPPPRICQTAQPGTRRTAPGHFSGANTTRCAPAPT